MFQYCKPVLCKLVADTQNASQGTSGWHAQKQILDGKIGRKPKFLLHDLCMLTL